MSVCSCPVFERSDYYRGFQLKAIPTWASTLAFEELIRYATCAFLPEPELRQCQYGYDPEWGPIMSGVYCEVTSRPAGSLALPSEGICVEFDSRREDEIPERLRVGDVSQEDFVQYASFVMKRARKEGTIVIVDSDGKQCMRISVPLKTLPLILD